MSPSELKSILSKAAAEHGSYWIRRLSAWLNLVLSDYTNLQALGLWVAAIVTGLLSVGYASAFRYLESFVDQNLSSVPEAWILVTPLAFLSAWFLVFKFAPEAAGSGIPQVMAAVETIGTKQFSKTYENLLTLKTAVIKIFSSLICLLGGGAIGREGPTLQVSAAVFYFFGRQVQRFYPNADQQTWIIAGSAAGLASAFNTPLGGIVYAIEELAATHFHRVKTALLTSVIISGLVAQTILGRYLYLGFPRLTPIQASTWPAVILTAVVAGIAGALFSRLLLRGLSVRSKIKTPMGLGLAALGCGLVVAALNYLDHRSVGPGNQVIADILFEGQSANFSLIASRILGTAFAYFSGAAGGVFAPSLTIGATIGSKISYLMGSTNINLLSMVGMIGFLTGVTHSPFTAFILILEMSDRHSAVFPMMIGALLANGVAKSIQSESFYEQVKSRILQR